VSPSPGFALIQLDREADAMDLARALAKVRGAPVQDQVLEARSARGIVAEGLSEDDARSLGRSLRSSGFPVALAPAGAVATLPEAEPAREKGALPAAPPFLVAAAPVTVTTRGRGTKRSGPSPGQKAASTAILMTTGMPIRVGGRTREGEPAREEEKLTFWTDLYYEDPGRRLRIDASRFDFSCLGERMLYQGHANLKLLLGDIVRDAPEAWLNRGTRVLLDGAPLRALDYRSLDDLDRESRWLLTLRAHAPS
jgi:hypothetical protein